MVYHTVKKGETYKKYKEVFGCSTNEIKKVNPGLTRLVEGKEIILPIIKKKYEAGVSLLNNKAKENVEPESVDLDIELDVKIVDNEEQNNELPKSNEYKVVTSSEVVRLNVRKEPSLDSEIIKKLLHGNVVVGEQQGEWLKLEDGGYVLFSKVQPM